MRRRRIELSGSYVVASAAATVTGAVIASFFGIYGTVIGTAVISVASTVGAAFYQATLQTGKEQLREIRPVVASRARAYRPGTHVGRQGEPTDTTIAGYAHHGADSYGADSYGADRYSADSADTASDIAGMPAAGDQATVAGDEGAGVAGVDDQATMAGGEGAGAATSPGEAVRPGEAVSPAAAAQPGEMVQPGEAAHPAEPVTSAEPPTSGEPGEPLTSEEAAHPVGAEGTAPLEGADRAGPAGEAEGGDAGRDTADVADQSIPGGADGDASLWRRIGWKRVAALAAAVFVVGIGFVTVIELLAGKPLNALVNGRHSSGTSVSNLFGRQPAASPSVRQPTPTTRPGSTGPTAQPTQSPNPSAPAPARPSARAPVPSPSPPVPSGGPGTGPPPSAPIPPVGEPTGGTRGFGTSAQGSPSP